MINQYARLNDAQKAYRYLIKLLQNPYPNLFNAHRHPKLTFYPLTIEANFGATAGIAEMLLQSHAGELHLLAALPAEWRTGRVKGLRARSGFEVEIAWRDGKLAEGVVFSARGGTCRVRIMGAADVHSFATDPGAAYRIQPEPEQTGGGRLLKKRRQRLRSR